MIRKVNGIRVGRDDVGKVLRIQWLGGAEPLEIVADRGEFYICISIHYQRAYLFEQENHHVVTYTHTRQKPLILFNIESISAGCSFSLLSVLKAWVVLIPLF